MGDVLSIPVKNFHSFNAEWLLGSEGMTVLFIKLFKA